MKTRFSFSSSSLSSSSKRGKGDRPKARYVAPIQLAARAAVQTGNRQFSASDLVNLVLERSEVFGCGNVNSVNNVDNYQPVSTFPACAPVRALLKINVAATGLQCRDERFSSAVHRMNKLNFTSREILEEVSRAQQSIPQSKGKY